MTLHLASLVPEAVARYHLQEHLVTESANTELNKEYLLILSGL